MLIRVSELEIFYERNFGDGDTIVILHGWGASVEAMRGIYNYLAKCGANVLMLDFPGFGKSAVPNKIFTIYDYADVVQKMLSTLQIQNPIILGHSFGGRVAIILGARGVGSKLILTDAAGIRPKFSLLKKTKILIFKFKRSLKLNTLNSGSSDYKSLSGAMRKIFVSVVNTHLDKQLANIKMPTLIIWGENDKDTPMYMAKKLNKKIANSGLVVIKNCGHYCFADDYVSYCLIIKVFCGLGGVK